MALCLAAVLGVGHGSAAAAPLTEDAKREVVAKAATLLAEGYVYPDLGRKAGAAIQKSLDDGAYAAITDKSAFANRLTDDLQAITHDKHMRVMDPDGPRPPGMPAGPPPRSRGGFIRVDRLKGDIGYIDLSGFPPPGMFKDAADAALLAVAGTDALVIDMRRNGGGSPEAVSYLCSFFFDATRPTHLNDLIWRDRGTETFHTDSFFTGPAPTHYLGKPVILITSHFTFSGGEEFTNDLKTQKRALVVGQTTGGGANPGGIQPLGVGLLLFVPSGRAVNPVTKASWEGVGVAPDITTSPEAAFATAYKAALNAVGASAARAAVKSQLAANGGEVDAWTEASLLAARTGPIPGAEAVLRATIADAASGKPNYAAMTPDFIKSAQDQFGVAHNDVVVLGALKSVAFERVDMLGADVYRATFEHGALEWTFYVNAEGKVAVAFYRKLPDAPV
ncbi:MAG TPA: S41 family peptidase [Phenylobacterium sp.]|nr:S41 family peptidase [Phenylobacterium sp.]